MKRLLMGFIMVLCGATLAFSGEVIFRIPVNLVNLHPDVNAVHVRCSLSFLSGALGGYVTVVSHGVSIPIGPTDKEVNDRRGRFYIRKGPSGVTDIVGIVRDRAQIDEEFHRIENSISYDCSFTLHAHGRTISPQLQNEAPEDFPIWAQADPTKPFVRIVRGTLPWARTR